MRTWRRLGAWIGGGLWLAACAKEVSVGDDACPRGTKCKVEHLALPRTFIDVHSIGGSIEPSWKASELPLEGSEVIHVDSHSELALGPSGGLWLFAPEPGQVGATLLDADASVVGHRIVEAPLDSLAGEGIPNLLATSHPRGPVVSAGWPIDCKGFVSGRSGEECDSPLNEVLVFGTDIDAALVRVSLGNGGGLRGNSLASLHRSEDGDALLFTGFLNSVVQKIDLRGDLLWRTSLSLANFDALPNTSTRQSSANPFRSGAVSPAGDLVFSVDIWEKDGVFGWGLFPSGLLRIDDDGATSLRLYEGNPADPPVGETPGHHPNAALAFDTQGRLLAVHPQLDGDLIVLRITDDDAESFRILREDYANLQLYDIAVDPEGTLYISSEGGGREPGSELPLLCRVPEAGSPRCVSIPARTFDIEAPAPSVVFALVGDELARFSFE